MCCSGCDMRRQRSRLASCGETAGGFSWRDDSMENEAHLVSRRSCSHEGLRERVQILLTKHIRRLQREFIDNKKLSHESLTVQDLGNPLRLFMPLCQRVQRHYAFGLAASPSAGLCLSFCLSFLYMQYLGIFFEEFL